MKAFFLERKTTPEPPIVEDQAVPKGKGNVSTRARMLYAQEGMRTKSRIEASLLALLLGMFGVHKFYLGYNQAGFLMMAITIIGGLPTFGLISLVVWMIAIIEAGLYLTKSQDDFEHTYVVNQRDWL